MHQACHTHCQAKTVPRFGVNMAEDLARGHDGRAGGRGDDAAPTRCEELRFRHAACRVRGFPAPLPARQPSVRKHFQASCSQCEDPMRETGAFASRRRSPTARARRQRTPPPPPPHPSALRDPSLPWHFSGVPAALPHRPQLFLAGGLAKYLISISGCAPAPHVPIPTPVALPEHKP